jgi:hypothetical protein
MQFRFRCYRTPYLAMDFRRWRPCPGEKILALGFADLDLDRDSKGDDRPIEQYLYGSFGRIAEIVPADEKSGRPWPLIRVDADWPGGMSGGPVFNEAGHVIGVVSAGISVHNTASATFLRAGTSQSAFSDRSIRIIRAGSAVTAPSILLERFCAAARTGPQSRPMREKVTRTAATLSR